MTPKQIAEFEARTGQSWQEFKEYAFSPEFGTPVSKEEAARWIIVKPSRTERAVRNLRRRLASKIPTFA